MSWAQLALAVATGIAILAVPGAAIAIALRLRGLWLAALTPVVGMTAIVVATVIAPALKIQWSIVPVLAVALITSLPIALVLKLAPSLRPRTPDSTSHPWVVPSAVLLAAGLLMFRIIRAIGDPQAFAQSFDNVFHLNAVQFILDTHNASPWHVGTLLQPENPGFLYPSGWHAFIALIAQLTGSSPALSTNAGLIVIGCGVWPLGAILLARVVGGDSRALTLAAGAISAGFVAYPLLLVTHVGAYALLGSVAFVAAPTAVAVSTLGFADRPIPLWTSALIMLGCVPAMAGTHPSAFVMFVCLLAAVACVAAVFTARRRPASATRVILLAILALTIALSVVVLVRPGIDQAGSWRGTPAQALGEVALNSLSGRPIAIVVSVLTIVGIIAAIRLRSAVGWAGIGIWITVNGLYVAAAGSDEFARLLFAGPWYSDATRVAAFAPVAAVPLAALGADRAWRWFRSIMSLPEPARWRRPLLPGISLALLSLLLVQSGGVLAIDRATRLINDPVENMLISYVAVGRHERELMADVERLTRRDDVIAGNPWDGSSFTYALTGRRVLVPHTLTTLDEDTLAFLDGFRSASPQDRACVVARKKNIRWVIMFHPDALYPNAPKFSGIENLDTSPNVELAAREGDSSLYKIVGCGMG